MWIFWHKLLVLIRKNVCSVTLTEYKTLHLRLLTEWFGTGLRLYWTEELISLCDGVSKKCVFCEATRECELDRKASIVSFQRGLLGHSGYLEMPFLFTVHWSSLFTRSEIRPGNFFLFAHKSCIRLSWTGLVRTGNKWWPLPSEIL